MGGRTTRGKNRGYGGAMGVIWEVYNMVSNVPKEAREFAEIIAATENARFERANKQVSAYVTESELRILQEIAERLGCSQSEAIRRAVRLYGILCGYENMGGEIVCKPGKDMLFSAKTLSLTHGGIERR